ncbi:MAG: chromosome partitioning protein ParA, partial [Rhodospirillales bacterium]|nr:chromosome partitioning protein ParA [Rhodospirillales bacterium]
MQFTRLSLTGFKSFVDRTELMIEPGLTGIVGPNGCGKSNLVEALRWVMGESSAKRMRGGEMDDVIFGGTSSRPPRNLAEVGLSIDNTGGESTPPFGEQQELEVLRRIERGSGSDYRVNGKEVRARDVQLLFADAATGSQSTALVSQGRIGAIINSKPVERRHLLEEAAGISGLHSRRHEAELRLKAAEANLERLDDVVVTLQAQFETLKKQARQAGRYRRLSDHIRRAEAILLHLRWRDAEVQLAQAEARLREAEREVGGRTAAALTAERIRTELAEALPGLRQTEAATAAEVQRLAVARDTLDQEERRVLTARGEAEQRLRQLAQDRAREDELAADAAAALGRLKEERDGLTLAQQDEIAQQQAAGSALRDAAAAVAALEAEVTRLTGEIASIEARRAALIREEADAGDRHRRLTQRLAETVAQRQGIEAERPEPRQLEGEADSLAIAETAVETARAAAEAAEAALAAARRQEGAARTPLQEAEGRRAKLRAEAQALQELLAHGFAGKSPPLLDAIRVDAGFEAALAAALGEDLAAPLDPAAPRHWRELPPYDAPPALPAGMDSLAAHVTAPPALARRLGQIGIIEDPAAAAALAPSLLPGQRLVSRDGALWRWDGFAVAAGVPTVAAQRLRQRNRLDQLKEESAAADAVVTTRQEELEAATATAAAAASAEAAARQAMRDSLSRLAEARDRHNKLVQRDAAIQSRLFALGESEGRLAADLAEAAQHRETAAETLAALADSTSGRDELARRRSDLAERRTVQAAAQGEHDRLLREAATRRQRIAAIVLEERSWQGRADGAERQREALVERHAALTAEIERLSLLPAEIAAQRETLVGLIETATTRRSAAGDALSTAESGLAEAEKVQKQADAALAAAREERVRCEGAVEHAGATRGELQGRIAERLDCAPDAILAVAEIPADEIMPPVGEAETRLERLVRERDGMGPVNLVAESEAAELEERITGLTNERADLTAAIARLRQGINALNHEGRERLLAAFTKVNAHFQELFVRLFGGGEAHLKLDEGEDPLAAGLEIFASPPGKRMQILSLLSGGEQALTALALLFAVFLTNPAPICVLDEVDAPLDDANVDRFCRLVEEIAASAETRFLIITHHRVT